MTDPTVLIHDYYLTTVTRSTGETYIHDGETREMMVVEKCYRRQFTACIGDRKFEHWSQVDARLGIEAAEREHEAARKAFVERLATA